MSGKRKTISSRKSEKLPPLSPQRILAVMRNAGRPLYLREIIHLSHLRPEEKNKTRAIVAGLVREGKLVLLKGDRYGISDLMELVTGKLLVHPDGFGFVQPKTGKGDDVFIPARGLKGAVHGDHVVARVEKTSGKGIEGSILRVLERGVKQVVGTFHKGRSVSTVLPEENRLLYEIMVPNKYAANARNGQVVLAEIERFPSEGRNPEGRVVEILGNPDDMGVQTKIVIHKHGLPHIFPPDTMAQARALSRTVVPDDIRGRKDLRDLPLVTIDGEHARDFDDAVFVKKTRTGFVLTVAIADVSHYVPDDSPIDQAAFERGTSVYFPDAVVPMLPETLSNHLCSLIPWEDRLAIAVNISFDREANVRHAGFSKAVIRSHCRFTYKEVRCILVDKDKDLIARNRKHIKHLKWMVELAGALFERRRQRGSIDFDLPEPEMILGIRGNLEEIVRRERSIAHRIIEEFMIAANEAVALFLTKKEIPAMYRVHEPPARDKVNEFAGFGRILGMDIKVPEEISPKWCQKVLKEASGKPQEYIINMVLLRTMQQAVYSSQNIGHFGLASPTYLHFTSPIRRYPDLIVHRILKANIKRPRKRPVYTEERLEALGQHCSIRERGGMEAEREMFDRLKVRFMADKIGEVYEGTISGVISFGFFVELKDMFISGVVRLVDIVDDYYMLDQDRQRLVGQRTHKVFYLGQAVRVRVKAVNVVRMHINFELVNENSTQSPNHPITKSPN
ncbi:MAG: ribonuclease R [Deltaproteobacteria bacterium]|nr:ribonuclease R [Deltaproteobacteria bacterium]